MNSNRHTRGTVSNTNILIDSILFNLLNTRLKVSLAKKKAKLYQFITLHINYLSNPLSYFKLKTLHAVLTR